MLRDDYDFLLAKIENFLTLKCPNEIKEAIWERAKDMEIPRSEFTLLITLLEGINSAADRITYKEFAGEIYKMEQIKGEKCPSDLIVEFWNRCKNLDSKSFQFLMKGVYEKEEKTKRMAYHYNS